ncbi:MAG: phosphatase domain-containing protein [Chitinophagaceae bacterium]
MQHAQGNIKKENNSNVKSGWKKKFLLWLGLTTDPVIKVYNGYGHKNQLVIYGHVLHLSPLSTNRFSRNIFYNTFSVLRLFMVRPYAGATVTLQWGNEHYEARTEDDGFFRIEWNPFQTLSPGWHPVQVNLVQPVEDTESTVTVGQGDVYVPHSNQYACVSDIDDTFLISHSSNLRKRLFVLLTKNAHSRKPFEGVVNHYQLLSTAGTNPDMPNPFFYVSSSEWNLYNHILEFSHKHNLPKGIYLLSQLKRLSQVMKTGQNKHATKFMRIARIFESYPENKYILLGDDTQEDPNIYSAIVEHFPGKVRCVYIRHVNKKNLEMVKTTTEKIKQAGVPCCYFANSAEAIEHSIEIGLFS